MARVPFGTLAQGARFRLTGARAAVVTAVLTKVSDCRAVQTVAWFPMHAAELVEVANA